MSFLSNLIGSYVVKNVHRMVDLKTFGSVVIFIIMFWFIVLARILITGAVLNATYQELKQGELEGRNGDVRSIVQKIGNNTKRRVE